jgi:uncharacterized membrane protein YfcA
LYFPVSGIEANPLVPLLAAFVISLLTAPAGVSGAFLLLPFQVSVLGFTSPAVSPTNLIYNIVATPGGIYRYVRERRVVWPLVWTIVLGTLPGAFIGAVLRVRYLADPRTFKIFVGFVLLYLGARLLLEALGRPGNVVRQVPPQAGSGDGRFPAGEMVKTTSVSPYRIEYEFAGRCFSFGTIPILLLSLVVGVIGGIYSIGGGSIIAPFLVLVFGLPVYTVAGAALIATFLTSAAGVVFFQILSATDLGAGNTVAPDWLLGGVFGIGGLAGTYVGARAQKYLPDLWIRVVLGSLVVLLALSYLSELFRS